MAEETEEKEKKKKGKDKEEVPQNKIYQPQQVEIMRSLINFANYNPRKISEKARKLLKQNLKRVGLLGGIVFNKTTGNLISGHQRVSICDDANRYNPETKEHDYPIRVEMVEMDEVTEREQNLFMNNKQVQGEFDDDMLREVLKGINYENAGLEEFDMQMLGLGDQTIDEVIYQPWNRAEQTGENLEEGQEKTAEQEFLSKVDEITSQMPERRDIDRSTPFAFDTAENQIARHNEMDKIKERISKNSTYERDHGMLSYVIVSFDNPSNKERFMDYVGKDIFDKYIKGEDLQQYLEFGEWPEEEESTDEPSEEEEESNNE